MKRSMCDAENECNDKKICHESYWKSDRTIKQTKVYICYIHYNDEMICGVYECRGIKYDPQNTTADNMYNI